MFNDLDEAFGALRDRAPRPQFAPASVVRGRGRRRRHRQIVVAGIAVVGVVAGAGALVDGPLSTGRGEPADSRSASAGVSTGASASSPAPTGRDRSRPTAPDLGALRAQYPDRLFLAANELPGMTYRKDNPVTGPMWPVILMCEGFADDWYSSLPSAMPGRQYGYAEEAPNAANMGAARPYANQIVQRYRDDGAHRMIANVDAFRTCRTNRGLGDRELARDFGGDESRLYVVPPVDPRSERTRHLIYVRVGDLATEVDLYGLVDDAAARAVATRIAERLAGA